ncbi:hypothetical protein GCM10009785_20220 [Brooklawnia cerclae]|uniref:DNA-binding protein YbaB n=1 Tax=Brooklawnia cerclae TaxID=349934 RepID=A0ABX0SKL9_9ACTN|nr:YbaB/EbfC family nucleoid-associated protein [Brooklawnia cerclae]NIH57236.1 DNA-binding protein YbaB [Brooklawnia cerclae]
MTTRSSADEYAHAIQEILSRTYEATSVDGAVTVMSVGEARVTSASIEAVADPVGELSQSATDAVQRSLRQARAETRRALADLPGLNPQLRALLLGGQ